MKDTVRKLDTKLSHLKESLEGPGSLDEARHETTNLLAGVAAGDNPVLRQLLSEATASYLSKLPRGRRRKAERQLIAKGILPRKG